MVQLPVDPNRVATFLDLNLRTGALGYAQKVDRAAVKKRAPEMLEAFESLQGKKKGALAMETLRPKYVESAKGLLAALAGKVPSEAELAALPPLVRAAIESAEDTAIYSSRHERSLLDPFPDGVVSDEFVFRRNLAFKSMQAAEKLILELDLGPAVAKQIQTKKGKKLTSLSGGLEMKVEKEPTVGGKKVLGLSGQGPFLVVTNGDLSAIAEYQKDFERLEVRHVEGRSAYAAPGTTYEKQSVFERLSKSLPGHATGKAKSPEEKTVQRFGSGFATLSSLGLLAMAIDQAAGGKKKNFIATTLREANRAQNGVLRELTQRDGWVDKYRQIEKLIRKHGEQSIGDQDLTIKIATKMERTDSDDNGHEKVEVVVKDQGPLLLVKEHAGSVSHAVRLDPLKEGRLEVFVAPDGEPACKFEVDAKGQLKNADRKYPHMYSVFFDVNLVLEQLRAEL